MPVLAKLDPVVEEVLSAVDLGHAEVLLQEEEHLAVSGITHPNVSHRGHHE